MSPSRRLSRRNDRRLARWLAEGSTLGFVETWGGAESTSIESAVEEFYGVVLAHGYIRTMDALDAVDRIAPHDLARMPPRSRALIARLRGNLLSGVGRFEEAHRHYARAWRAFDAAGEWNEQLKVATGWIDTLSHISRFDQAQEICRRGRKLIPAADKVWPGKLDLVEANMRQIQGKRLEALRLYRRARRRTGAARDFPNRAHASYNLGNALLYDGQDRKAEPILRDALAEFQKLGLRRGAAYSQVKLGMLDLVAGNWARGMETLESARGEIRDLGDARLLVMVQREEAEFLASVGALERAEHLASRSYRSAVESGMPQEAARSAFLHARILAGSRRYIDARVRLREAQEAWRATDQRVLYRRAQVELARIHFEHGEFDVAQRLLREVSRYLQRIDPQDAGVRCRYWMARCHLESGRPGLALKLVRRAHRDARSYPVRLERPGMALACAQALSGSGDRRGALTWARRAVDQAESIYLALGTRSMRGQVSASLVQLMRGVADVVLANGGATRAREALDLLMRARTPQLVEDLLHAGPSFEPALRASIARMRDALIERPIRSAGDARPAAVREQVEKLQERVASRFKQSPRVVRAAMSERGFRKWAATLRGRTVVSLEQEAATWAAYVVRPDSKVERIVLPDAARALSRHWIPLLMMFDHAASLPADARGTFLERTGAEADDALQRLSAAIWAPLQVSGGGTLMVPSGAMHGVPLEGLPALDAPADLVVSRWPHPAVARVDARSSAARAFLLHDGSAGTVSESRAVGALLRRAGVRTRQTGSRRMFLQPTARVALLHVAAHGSFHRQEWLLNGIRLKDGWIGFEHLRRPELRDALLYFASCESGLGSSDAGPDLSGWIGAGLGAGARELILSLWKIDDESAQEFAREFYAGWTAGISSAAAADRARRALRTRRAHPFSWAPFLAVG